MFKSIGKSLAELSTDLREREDWEVGTLRTLDRVLDANVFAFDPVSSILAVGELPPFFWYFGLIDVMASDSTGTTDGTIRIFGAPGVETNLSLPSHVPIKFLQFATNVFKLVCIGEYDMVPFSCPRIPLWPGFVDHNDRLHLWDLTAQGQIKVETSMFFDRPVTSV